MRHAELADDAPLRRGVIGELRGVTEQEHPHVRALGVKSSRDHHAVATIVAEPAEDEDADIGHVAERVLDGAHHLMACVLHENERGHADLLDGVAIRLAHLLRAQNSHEGLHRGRAHARRHCG